MTCNPQSETRSQRNLGSFSTRLTRQVGLFCLTGTVLMSGCVSSSQYEAEKARALNYQRLLAQEEQRTGELDVRLQEAQQQIESLGAQNRELTAERDTFRNQAGGQPGSAGMSGTASDMDLSPEMSLSDSALSDFDLSFDESEFNDLGMDKGDAGMDMAKTGDVTMGTPTYYTVVKGDTLYRISRTYGVTVDQLKKWNRLTDNTISIGQRLIVSQP